LSLHSVDVICIYHILWLPPIFSLNSVDVICTYHILWLSSIFSLYYVDVIYSYHIMCLSTILSLGLSCLSSTVCRGCHRVVFDCIL